MVLALVKPESELPCKQVNLSNLVRTSIQASESVRHKNKQNFRFHLKKHKEVF